MRKKAFALLLSLAMVASLATVATAYTDVPAEENYASAVNAVTEKGLMIGIGNDLFAAEGNVTRGTLITVLGRLAAVVPTAPEGIEDETTQNWCSGYANWATSKGILSLENGRLNASKAITLTEMENAFAAYAKLMGRDYRGGSGGIALAKRSDLAIRLEKMMDADYTIHYSNVNFDFSAEIAKEMAAVKLTPDAADIGLSVTDATGASGVVLTGAEGDYYLNTYVAGSELTFSGDISSAASSISGELKVANKQVKVTPAALMATDPVDEVITFTMADNSTYTVHTVNAMLPTIKVTEASVADKDSGVYHFDIDHFALSVSTTGELVYYRSFSCVGDETMCENFSKQATVDGDFYAVFVELNRGIRNAFGSYSSGMYLIMDKDHKDIDKVTLLPNNEANHNHGQGYLDQHEMVVLGKDHYLTLSYTQEYVDNIPYGAGTGGSTTGYVWAGVIQEVKNGVVVAELNTTDYPFLYETAIEQVNYSGSSDKGATVAVGQNEVLSMADSWSDYAHVNSLDYTLNADGSVNKLLVSMRNQSAVFQFDMATGAIDWVLGGRANTLTGFSDYTSTRKDEAGYAVTVLSFGQHCARYMNRNADGTITGDPQISVFDNQTGTAPFLFAPPAPVMIPNSTRTFTAIIDEDKGTATVGDVITGLELNKLSSGYHNASHCGSVEYLSDTSVVIGWGLHAVIDSLGPFAPAGTCSDKGFPDLRQGSRPVFTEYDMENGKITFELCVNRNPNVQSSEGLYSYRTYKTAN